MADTLEASATAAIRAMPPGVFAVAGFSLGGYVTFEVCRQAPDRIAGIALLDTGARADSEEAVQSRKCMAAALESGGASFAQIAGAFAPRLLHESRASDSQLIDLLVAGRHGANRRERRVRSTADGGDEPPRQPRRVEDAPMPRIGSLRP
jgi:pimeloyl-ACP methyl ester carboxylesterase